MGALEQWHQVVRDRDMEALSRLLHPDAVFESPIVHRRQEGRELCLAYLGAAMEVLGGRDFRYVGEWSGPDGVVLEFRTRIEDVEVNGVDLIRFDSTGRQIVHFKVMLRPMRAIEAVGMRMMEALASGS